MPEFSERVEEILEHMEETMGGGDRGKIFLATCHLAIAREIVADTLMLSPEENAVVVAAVFSFLSKEEDDVCAR